MKDGFIKVEGEQGLVRDPSSNAILNINRDQQEAARDRLRRFKMKEQELQDLKNDVGELKSLLMQLLEEKRSHG
jgi:uncharacterized protein involved in exopolysaccharide biosynthesis